MQIGFLGHGNMAKALASWWVGQKLKAIDAELEARAQAVERQRADIKRAQTFLQGCHGCRLGTVH